MKKKLKIACLQIEAKEYKDRDQTEKNILKMIDVASKGHPQLMVLPEAAYPAYFLSPLIVKNVNEFYLSTLKLIEKIKRRAKKYHCYIALGFVENDLKEKKLYNAALLVNPEGKEISRTRKSFLWHFDSDWFSEGDNYPVVETDIGKIGMFICADGRLPEIPRCLCLKGADILLDLTNWVTGGFDEKNLTNPQAEYMVPVRALENHVWIIAANKVGMEANSILYCGRSAVFTPQGEAAKMASSHNEEIIFYKIPLKFSENKLIEHAINIKKDRRPELYSELVHPTNNNPIYSIIQKKISIPNVSLFTAIVQIDSKNDIKDYLEKITYCIENLMRQDVELIVFPENNFCFPEDGIEIIERICKTIQNNVVMCAVTVIEKLIKNYYKTTYLLNSGKIIGKYRKTHLEVGEKELLTPGDLGLPVFKTSGGNIGIMLGYEGFFPEIARTLTLKGADIIIWPSKFDNDQQIKISRSRSAENKIFIACSNSISGKGNGHSLITSPSGNIMAACLKNKEQSNIASLYLQLSRNKNIVPHTDAILNRNPKSYQSLVKKKGE